MSVSSPTGWPNVSLISLNPSMSRRNRDHPFRMGTSVRDPFPQGLLKLKPVDQSGQRVRRGKMVKRLALLLEILAEFDQISDAPPVVRFALLAAEESANGNAQWSAGDCQTAMYGTCCATRTPSCRTSRRESA